MAFVQNAEADTAAMYKMLLNKEREKKKMNMKKFISLASATALVSSLAVVPMAAHAEGETVIWSDTFNTYSVPEETYNDWLKGVLIEGYQKDGEMYEGIPGIKLQVGSRADGDDSTYWTLNAKSDNAEDKYLTTATGRFSTQSRGAKLIFNEAQEATADKDIVLAFDVASIKSREEGITYDRGLAVYGDNNAAFVDFDSYGLTGVEWDSRSEIGADNWDTVKVVVTASGTTVYMNDSEQATSDATKLTGLDLSAYIGGALAASGSEYRMSDGKGYGYPAYAIDNMIVYSTAAGEGAASTIPEVTDNTQTPPPAPTDAPPAAEITDTVTVDFDQNTLAAAGITVTNHKDYTTIDEASTAVSDTQAMSIAQTSTKDNSYGYATLDFANITDGKSHIIIEYDLYVTDGRVKVILQDGPVSGSVATSLPSGLISQGITKTNSYTNALLDGWVHTIVDVDLASGAGTYTVTNLEDSTEVGSGRIKTDLTAVNTMSFVSWYTQTSYLDNLVIKTGGTMEGPELATPEPASKVPGSELYLEPEGVTALGGMDAAMDANAETILNHTAAAKVVATTEISAYSDKVRGNSMYAAYDVYITPGSEMKIRPLGDSGKAQASTVRLTANKDNTVTLAADTDKGTVTSDARLVTNTWYRALLEVPQSGDASATSTDPINFKLYRIDAENPAAATEVAAELSGLSARGLANRGVSAFGTDVTGDVYIDNTAVFVYTKGYSFVETPVAEVTPEPASTVEGSNVNLVPESARTEFDATKAEGAALKILNHSEAKVLNATADIDIYNDKVRGNSIYVAYDVLVEKGAAVQLIPHGDSGKAQAATLQLTADDLGAVTVSAIVGSNDKTVTAKETLAAGTWYRVVVEIPQNNNGGNTATGDITYTVYRIDSSDPTKTAEVAAELSGLSARGLADRGATSLEFTVDGEAYIDNTAAYVAAQSHPNTYTKYTVTYDETGRLTSVASEVVEDPTTVEVVTDNPTSKTLLWKTNTVIPYIAE